MSATYVAWNGLSYPWPPPEGWYLASDSQWWAPGTGPNPPPTPQSDLAEAQRDAKVHATTAPDSGVRATATQHQQVNADATSLQQASSHQAAQTALADTPGAETAPVETAPNPDLPATPGADESPAGDNTLPNAPGAIWQQPSKRPSGGLPRWLLVGLAILALLVIGGLIALAVSSGDDDQIETSAAAEPEQNSTTTVTTVPPTTTTVANTTTTDVDTQTTEVDTLATTIAPQLLVAEFRSRLDEDDLSAEQLSDADIVEFGATFCVLAEIADDNTEFGTFRAQAIAESTGDLTPDELSLVINDVIIVFCPEEAARLDIN